MNQLTASDNKHLHWVDAIRGLVILFMLIGHSEPPETILIFIFGFHMPFFFILSGYLYNPAKWENLGLKNYIINKFKAYMIPYFIFCLVVIIVNIPIEIMNVGKEGLIHSIASNIGWVLYSLGGSDKLANCTPLWFLPAMFVSSIYLFLIFKVSNQLRVLLFAGGIFLNLVLSSLHVLPLPWHVDVAMIGALLMYVGYIIKEKSLLNKRFSLSTIGVIAFVALYVLSNNNRITFNGRVFPNMFNVLSGGILTSFVIMDLGNRIQLHSKFLEIMGRNTILFMAFNYTITSYGKLIWFSFPLSSGYSYNWIVNSVVSIVTCFILALLWELLTKKIPVLKIATGKYNK